MFEIHEEDELCGTGLANLSFPIEKEHEKKKPTCETKAVGDVSSEFEDFDDVSKVSKVGPLPFNLFSELFAVSASFSLDDLAL